MTHKNWIRLFSFAVCGALAVSTASPKVASAESHRKKHDKKTWAENHPERVRQAEERREMNHEISHEKKSGKITQEQAEQLHKEVRQEGEEVRRDAASYHNG